MSNDSTERIVAHLRAWIAAAPAGARLPSSRALTRELGVSPVTVQKAMHQLNALGLIETRPGVGTFVRAGRPPSPVDFGWQTGALGTPRVRIPSLSSTQQVVSPDAIALHSGYPTRELLPTKLVQTAIARAARSASAAARSPAGGLPELQTWFANELAGATLAGAPPVTGRDVIILPGSQSGLSSIFRAVVGPGQPLAIESPTYWGAIVAAAQAGVVLVPIPTGSDGPNPETVDDVLRRSGARAFYAQPTFANPTGAQWSPERSRAILDIVRNRRAFLIEDDWAHDLGIDADPAPIATHDTEGHVIYLRSLTKSVSPALRVAAVIARGPVRDRIFTDLAAETMYVSGLLQTAALEVVSQPSWRAHLKRLRMELRTRRDFLAESVAEHVPQAHIENVPAGGLNLWLRLPQATDLARLSRDTAAHNVFIAAGDEWFPAEAASPHIRLNFSGPEPERYPEAARAIGVALTAQGC